ncbi:MDN1-like protein [Mya arenaria]|uniref:Midasin n=1 Tax=Mya arenaria TaxID=6604 RepID=A0ABY7EDH3_MYAAR|nr:MDN1-like protein [Mya arenaria]
MDKSTIGFKIFDCLDFLCRNNASISKELSKFLSKQIWSPSDRREILEKLSDVFLTGQVRQFGAIFRPLLLDIITRTGHKIEECGTPFDKHLSFCVALSSCLHWPDIQRFTLSYVKGKPSFLAPENGETAEPKKKKRKKSKGQEVTRVQAAWLFTKYLGEDVTEFLPLVDILPFTSNEHGHVKWFACQTVVERQGMSPAARKEYLLQHFTEDKLRELTIKFSTDTPHTSVSTDVQCVPELTNEVSHTRHMILETDFCDKVTCVGGVLLSKKKTESEVKLDLLPVPSNEKNLHSIAMAVSAGSPVLLQGVVGSGKTTLVEHLAKLTGRATAPALMKIQLGDQMDSKALLGTYRCTEVPGEFVWQPGVLTQAVTNGYWVLLEDIDEAPMEVVSVLLPLLETRALSVPGHGDTVRAAPGFHLFATQRLVSSSAGWQRKQTGSSALLEKLWTSVLVEPLSRDELKMVICTKYPALETVVDRLLDIYFMLSAGGHEGSTAGGQQGASAGDIEGAPAIAMEMVESTVGKFLSRDGRQISTRDLMTWCGRVGRDFDVVSPESGSLALQEAMDCFVACISRPARRFPLAEAIGAKLNVSKPKVEYFCEKYKPDVTVTPTSFTVGRVTLPIQPQPTLQLLRQKSTFSFTRQSSILLERVAMCMYNREPVLLVGETGTGKTSSVQYLAQQLGHKLHVINMNQQSDSADLLGGFKPVDVRHIIKPFYEDFELLFCKTFSRKQNAKFLGHLQECFGKRKWEAMFSLMDHTSISALSKFKNDRQTLPKWSGIHRRLGQLKLQVQQTQNALAFTFMEGSLVKAMRSGDWVLLDEINLAAMETLECLSGLLESDTGSVLLMERGDVEPVKRHPDFRLFACMNPATDVGKRDLSPGIRNRFTELFVDELEDSSDLKILVRDYLQGLSLTAGQLDGVVKFYLTLRSEATKKLTDGTGHPPHYSLRTLCRALRFAALNSCGSVPRSLYEGFCLSFLTQLDRSSHPVVQQLVCQNIIGRSNVKGILKQPLPAPPGGQALNFEGYWIKAGGLEPATPQNYILTPSVRANLKDLARVVSAGQHPVLLQGETSVGKTSLINWLAQSSGNMCVRVNNHEHTDLQEYVGSYAADENGKLAFKEGVLVEAMKKGHWIILDELNLAPTDVLEALNRLLDDNRELFIAETQEMVRAQPGFMLFATQNPPGHYGGRKMLSRAFRNRFVELHFDEIPSKELETILHERCDIPLSYARRLVAVMGELQTRRRGSGVFAGKMGFMTLRDLFRWAERYKCPEMDKKKFYNWDKHLADQGYMLLAGRVRKAEETEVIQEVIQKHFKCRLDASTLFTMDQSTSLTSKSTLEQVLSQSATGFHHIVWTYSMRRLAVLIGQAIKYNEPILLVGETGCGKTTMCQLYAALNKSALHGVNCHLHTDSADFMGGLRPIRDHQDESKKDKLFEWVDGPLVQAMKEGAMFLIDEISLADDSVLERLNSVLEPERTILLAEKGGGDGGTNEVEQVVARGGFHVFATMNPGGDFGKKELSPALRNRFTEIWCPPSDSRQDLINIIEHNLHSGIHLCNQEDGTSGIGRAIMDFVEWFRNNEIGKRCTVSIRDILTWVHFINTCARKVDTAMETDQETPNQLEPAVAYIHGACLVFLDGLGAGTTSQGKDDIIRKQRSGCLAFLLKQVNSLTHQQFELSDLGLLDYSLVTKQVVMETENDFCIPPFSIVKGDKRPAHGAMYALEAPGTCRNAQRVLRGLQLPRPLLLEGSPGVGKTSLVTAIARASGRDLVRINLSEQTDVTDLFGADLPVEGAEGGVFAWRDGPLLQALKAGSWIVLDELNLASQSVLEGLNACLDHRAEVYVPELGKTFHIQHERTRLFACQNPLNQGGGRKGLPRSFLNRFTQVYVEPLSEADLMFIATTMYTDIPEHTLRNMVTFNMKMHEEAVLKGSFGQKGGPWEFNLRDLFRWCDLLVQNQSKDHLDPGEYIGLIYSDRMRTVTDKQQVYNLFQSLFPADPTPYSCSGVFYCDLDHVQVGHSFLKVKGQGYHHGDRERSLQILHHSLGPLESLMKCVEMNWMAILVGSPSSGKSSTVEMLAQLTGNRLNVLAMNSAMDTTELLGGFEQADESRHIEEVAADVKVIVDEICSRCLLLSNHESIATVTKLQELWKQFTSCTLSGIGVSSSEEVDQRRAQITKLQAVNKVCRKAARSQLQLHDLTEKVSTCRQRLTKLQEKLSLAVAGKGGGAFEWIDSLLVKSLIQGDWLLVDNVNFCSASVLDRLNALLEPHGVLSINERGVIDGEIPTIKPHPDFRLFLCMDARHGEISRAMRNRGIEIYIPGEEDSVPYETHDLKLIASGLGLKSMVVFDWLLELHNLLREELPRGDKPGVQSLLQVAAQVVQHSNHGNNLEKSVKAACHSVYVQRQRHTQARKLSLELVGKHLESWPGNERLASPHPELGLFPRQLPDVAMVTSDPDFAMVMRNMALFMHEMETNHIRDLDGKLKHVLELALSLTPESSFPLMIDWLQTYCNNKQADLSGVCKYVVPSLQEVTSHLAAVKVSDNMAAVFRQSEIACTAMDLQWNVQYFDRQTRTVDSGDLDDMITQLTTLFNRLHVQQRVQVELYLLRRQLESLQAALDRDKSRGQQTTHEAIPHLVSLFPLVAMAITNAVPDMNLEAYPEVVKVLEAFQCWIRLYHMAAEMVTARGEYSMLSLFWKWAKKALQDTGCFKGKQISTIVSSLQAVLSKDDKKWKVFVKFRRSWGHPRPFESNVKASLYRETMELFRCLELGPRLNDLLNEARVKVMVKHRLALVDAASKLLEFEDTENIEDYEEVMQSIQQLLTNHKLLSRHDNSVAMEIDDHVIADNQSGDGKADDLPVTFVQLWPVFDHCAFLEGYKMLEKLFLSNVSSDHMDSFHSYLSFFTTFKPTSLVLFKEMKDLDSKVHLSQVQAVLLERLRKGHNVLNPGLWLTWNEKHSTEEDTVEQNYSVLQPVLSVAMTSLLSRPDKMVSMETADVKIGASVKSYSREITQLSYLSQHVWTHVCSYSSLNTLDVERGNLIATLVHSLKSMDGVMSRDCPEEYTQKLETIATSFDLSEDSLKSIDYILHVHCTLKHMEKEQNNLMDEAINSVAMLIQGETTVGAEEVGQTWVKVGLFNMAMLAPQAPVDPVEKLTIKMDILKEELAEVETELDVLCTHHRLVTGQELTEQSDRLVHPRVPYLKGRLLQLGEQIAQLEKQVAYRPTPSQYSQLVADVKNFMSSVASVEAVGILTDKLLSECRQISMATVDNVLRRVGLWERSVDKFLDSLERQYPIYRDITAPFMCAVQQMVHGMHLLRHEVKRGLALQKLNITSINNSHEIISRLEDLVCMVGKFPSLSRQVPSCLHLATALTSDPSLTLVKQVLSRSNMEDTPQPDQVLTGTDSILLGCLHHLVLEAETRGQLTSNLVVTLTLILDMYVLAWQQEEEARKVKEQEEASLYRYKSQVHGDERSEEEQIEAEFLHNFPTYKQDFLDLMEPNSLEEINMQTEDPDEPQPSLHVTSYQMTLICRVHQRLYNHLVHTDWYKPVAMETLKVFDWIKPVLATYTAASLLTVKLADVMSSRVDSKLLGGHLVVSAVQQYCIQQASEQADQALVEGPSVYDIYHDPNIPEVIQCRPVMNALRSRVTELQGEWPDHPTLKQLHEIMDRIESFPITSPVMKFLTGIELLLQSAQEWESNASQHVSMATQLGEISRLIVQWRKLELSCWSKALDTEEQRYQSAASKWFFHVYQTAQATLQINLNTENIEESPPTIEEFTKIIKQFMEKSTLGDFQARLQMIVSFHCSLVAMESQEANTVSMDTEQNGKNEVSMDMDQIGTILETDAESDQKKDKETSQETIERRRIMANVLWNVYQFYSRFFDSVKAELHRLRQPIEKELKGFVKIARWSDINYWALKLTAEKTHRTLHKHLKKFQGVLQLPVQGILGDVATGATSEPGAGHSTWADTLLAYHEALIEKLRHFQTPAVASLVNVDQLPPDQIPLQHKLSQLCSRVNKHWVTIVTKGRYCERVAMVDQFTGELIEEIHSLQALDVNRTLEKEKQKSEAKHINLRRRKALSDLFKYLANLGLSYRKGLMACEQDPDAALKVTPLDLNVVLQGDSSVQNVWSGCQEYFYRCVSRRSQFLTALASPSKELGISNIDRCKGFAEHLYSLLIRQQKVVATLTSNYKHIRNTVTNVEKLKTAECVVQEQGETIKWMDQCRTLVVQMIEGLSQFHALLLCCPGKQGQTTFHPSPLPTSDLHEMALVRFGDEKLKTAITDVQELVAELRTVQASIPCPSELVIVIRDDIQVLQNVFQKIHSYKPKLISLAKQFSTSELDKTNAFTDVLNLLIEESASKWTQFEVFYKKVNSGTSECFEEEENEESLPYLAKIESVIASVLLVVQKQKKKADALSGGNGAGTGENDGEEPTDEMEEGQLVKRILDSLQEDSNTLKVTEVLDTLQSLVKDMTSHRTSSREPCLVMLTNRLIPFLHQYEGIVHHHLVSNTAAMRTTGKLLSVLLGVFTDLAAKGFCIPPEFSDEMSGEGATDFCDIEEGGLGDGEGVKNVSDQIENEDQLDEAKRPEDYKPEDQSDQPDIKSEENAIEMSEDFEAKVQDLEDVDKQEDDDEKEDEGEEDVDKQMGDEDKKEETGPGGGKQSESELVAKDDNEDQDTGEDKETEHKDEDNEEENERKPKELDMDQEDYDDDQVDPYHGKQEEQQAPEDLDLPDDLNLDDAEDNNEKEGEQETEHMDENDTDETKLPPEEGPDENNESEDADVNKEEETTKDNEEETQGQDEGTDAKEEPQDDKDENERKEEEGHEDPGFTPEKIKDEAVVNTEDKDDTDTQEADDTTQAVEHHGKTSHDQTENVEQSDTAKDAAGESMENDQQESEGTGQATAEASEGHQGQKSHTSADSSAQAKRKMHERQPGKADSDRSLGSDEQKYKRLKTTDTTDVNVDDRKDTDEEREKQVDADEFEHVKDSQSHYDTQTLDVATAEQLEEQGQITQENEEADKTPDQEDEMEEEEQTEDDQQVDNMSSAKLKKKSKPDNEQTDNPDEGDSLKNEGDGQHEIPGEKPFDLESLREELESQLGSWSQSNLPVNTDMESAASELWHRYEALTGSLAQDLCEQLRLVLEPSQATKLKGDYRTGKRLNMRKVIPYIASQFRKDKIWLRRTKPSKRQYQIMLAIDDSSSMVDNHSKQMAFESLSLISNALTLLEAGQLSICSFGETVNVLHPFTEQFTSHSGAHLLQYLTFEQRKTKIAQLLKQATSMMLDAREKQPGPGGNPETSQLLMVVSDGRGLFMEGMEAVKTAVRQAREASVFIVFVIIDNPVNKDSILDIKVPVFKQAGQVPEIKSYMDSFPFPFYIILRDINSLPKKQRPQRSRGHREAEATKYQVNPKRTGRIVHDQRFS